MSKPYFVLAHSLARRRAMAAVAEAPNGHIVTIAEPARNLAQNAAQWPILEAFSEQKKWPVNGVLSKLTPEEWKDVLTAAFMNETVRIAQGLNGGLVMLGQRTSKFGKRRFSEWLDFLHATAAERGVDLERELAEEQR